MILYCSRRGFLFETCAASYVRQQPISQFMSYQQPVQATVVGTYDARSGQTQPIAEAIPVQPTSSTTAYTARNQSIPVAAPAVPIAPTRTPTYVQGTATRTPDVIHVSPYPLPYGALPGGRWYSENYIGPITLIMCLLVLLLFWPGFWLPLLCPCDQQDVYVAPNGVRYYRPA